MKANDEITLIKNLNVLNFIISRSPDAKTASIYALQLFRLQAQDWTIDYLFV